MNFINQSCNQAFLQHLTWIAFMLVQQFVWLTPVATEIDWKRKPIQMQWHTSSHPVHMDVCQIIQCAMIRFEWPGHSFAYPSAYQYLCHHLFANIISVDFVVAKWISVVYSWFHMVLDRVREAVPVDSNMEKWWRVFRRTFAKRMTIALFHLRALEKSAVMRNMPALNTPQKNWIWCACFDALFIAAKQMSKWHFRN